MIIPTKRSANPIQTLKPVQAQKLSPNVTNPPTMRAPQQFGGTVAHSKVPEAAIRGMANGSGPLAQQNASFEQHYGVMTPVADANISQLEGNKPKGISYAHGFHTGTDFSAPIGTDARSVKEGGVVKFSGPAGAYGNQVIIEYPDKTQAVYNHLSNSGVKVGQELAKGENIGQTGNTGHTTGPHLDLEARKGNVVAAPSNIWNQQSNAGKSAFDTSWQGAETGVGNRSVNVGPSPSGGGPINASGNQTDSRVNAFNIGTVSPSSGGSGQQVNLGALNQVPMRKRASPVSTPIAAAPVEFSPAQSTNPGTTTRIKSA